MSGVTDCQTRLHDHVDEVVQCQGGLPVRQVVDDDFATVEEEHVVER